TYDPVTGLVKTISHYGGGTPSDPYSGTALTSYSYSYDELNRLQTQRIDGGATTTFQYDLASELTQDGYHTYEWDAAGNRTNGGFDQGANKGNQLATDGTWNYTYDAEGNVSSKTHQETGESWTYSYDLHNHLIEAVDTQGSAVTTVSYDYD